MSNWISEDPRYWEQVRRDNERAHAEAEARHAAFLLTPAGQRVLAMQAADAERQKRADAHAAMLAEMEANRRRRLVR